MKSKQKGFAVETVAIIVVVAHLLMAVGVSSTVCKDAQGNPTKAQSCKK